MQIEDSWIHEHWEMALAAAAVIWAFLVWSFRTMFSFFDNRYATEEQLTACHSKLSEKIEKVEDELTKEIRSNRDINTKEHNDIIMYLGRKE